MTTTEDRERVPAPALETASAPARRVARRTAGVLAVTLAVVLAGYLALVAWALIGVHRYPGWVGATSATGALNVLLIGTDAAPGQPGRADTLVVVHLPADRSGVYLISLPRSTQASLRQGVIQLKTARLIGGVPLTVLAVQQVTGLIMDHAIETDFAGLAGLADVVGGVTVPTPSGDLGLQGKDVLAYVRDHTVTDDVRNQRQRLVLKALFGKLPATVANPVGLARLTNEFVGHVSVDEGLIGSTFDLLRRVLDGRDRIVGVPAPLLPRENPWDRARVDPVRMAELAAAANEGRMSSYRPAP